MYKNWIVHSSKDRIFVTKGSDPTQGQDVVAELSVDFVHANNHSVYATCSGAQTCIHRYTDAPEGGNPLEKKAEAKLPGVCKAISGDDTQLYVLIHTGDILVLGAEDLAVKKTFKVPFANPLKLVYSIATGELWVGDKKGVVHVLKGDDFSEVATFTKHTQEIRAMAASADGKLIASGDSYRYTYVIDAESKEDVQSFAFQAATVWSLAFSPDGTHITIVSNDQSIGYGRIEDKKHKHVKLPHGSKEVKLVMAMPDGNIATVGSDCCIRIWNLSVE